jgi:hypothetical protein
MNTYIHPFVMKMCLTYLFLAGNVNNNAPTYIYSTMHHLKHISGNVIFGKLAGNYNMSRLYINIYSNKLYLSA